MNDRERLLGEFDRYFDGEMSREEAEAFVEAVSWDSELHSRFLQTLEAVQGLSRLPVVEPPRHLSAGEIRRAAAERSGAIRRIGLVAAGLAASILLGVGLYTLRRIDEPETRPSAPAEVTFHLDLRDAKSVSLVGDFNRWDREATPLRPEGGGWSVTLSLDPGKYEYQYVVDGQKWVLDPASPMRVEDGFGGTNSMVVVGK